MTHSSLDPTALYTVARLFERRRGKGPCPAKGFCSQEWSTIFHVYEGPTQHLFGN